MSRVRDIMSPHVLYVRDGDRTTLVRSQILKFGVTGVPVLDAADRPVGFVSLRDIEREQERLQPTEPALAVRDDETVEAAAKKLAESDRHHLVVVDGSGVAVGMVSAIDFVRALTGTPAKHPARLAE